VRARTARPFGVNFLMPFLDPACVPLAAERARVVEFFWAAPDEKLVAQVHAAGALALWQVGDADEARAAADAGCDLVVAQGVEAGGHVRGTRPLSELLPRVLDAVSLPVIAAGGIATAARVAELLRAGAAAVRVGTPFLAAREADAHPDWVRAVIAAKAADTVLTTGFGNGWPDAPHRVLRASLEHARALTDEFVGEVALAGARIPVPRLSPMPPTREASGHVAAMCQYAGTSVDHVTRVCSAAEIVSELMAGVSSR
jgi:NAD(P)H-dependent flavin oxidoreductase YrpB (nitropropane dioxygenase family)